MDNNSNLKNNKNIFKNAEKDALYAKELSEICDILYILLNKNPPKNIILYHDLVKQTEPPYMLLPDMAYMPQAELRGTQRLSIKKRLLIHRAYIKRLYKQGYYELTASIQMRIF